MCNMRCCSGVQIVLKIIDCAVANCIRSELCPKNSIFTFCVVVRRFLLSLRFSVVFFCMCEMIVFILEHACPLNATFEIPC